MTYHDTAYGSLYNGNCISVLKDLAESSIDCCITSPPYWGLRDYGTAQWRGGDPLCDHIQFLNKHGGERADRNQEGYKKQYKSICRKCGATKFDLQIGLEENLDDYLLNLRIVFAEVFRVLKKDGTLWLNLGDSYAGSSMTGGFMGFGYKQMRKHEHSTLRSGLRDKDLIGIPWMVAFTLKELGFYLRQDIIWHKPNPMPESVKDRCTKAHEYIFLMTKRPNYYFDQTAMFEKAAYDGRTDTLSKGSAKYSETEKYSPSNKQTFAGTVHDRWSNVNEFGVRMRNRRSVWTVPTNGYAGAHFATFPIDLINPMVMTTRKSAVILDPFFGSGTTGIAAIRNGRKYLGIELSREYCDLAASRIDNELNQLTIDL